MKRNASIVSVATSYCLTAFAALLLSTTVNAGKHDDPRGHGHEAHGHAKGHPKDHPHGGASHHALGKGHVHGEPGHEHGPGHSHPKPKPKPKPTPYESGRITRIEIAVVESPAFAGAVFGDIGQYERVTGRMYSVMDPDDPRYAHIVDLDKAPRNSDGLVEFDSEFVIFKPIDLSKANGRMLFTVPNRGGSIGRNDFEMSRGYILVTSGWQPPYPIPATSFYVGLGSRLPSAASIDANLPIVQNPDGLPVTGLSREEYVGAHTWPGTPPYTAYLTYPAASTDASNGTITVRQNERDPRQTPPGLSFEYLNEYSIRITPAPGFDIAAIHEFIYEAKDPIVTGLGFAAMRDVVSFLRYESKDDFGNPNPLAIGSKSVVKKVIGRGSSQSGRTLKQFIYEGFNADGRGRIVLDGANIHISGGSMNSVNFRFGQPGRKSSQHEDHFQPGDQFPFAYPVLFDPISGRTDGLLARCQATNTCPKIVHTDSENEIWAGRASLVYTDTLGRDIRHPHNVRVYLFSSTHHGSGGPTTPGSCENPRSPLRYDALSRALLIALDDWVTLGKEPPPSRHPTRAARTLVLPEQSGFPAIPSLSFNPLVLINEADLTDYSTFPPTTSGRYPIFVNKADDAGNGIGGIRSPDVEVPLATYTGWNPRGAGYAPGQQCIASGSYAPLPATKEERKLSGDPRRSIEERYPARPMYLNAVRRAADALVRARLLLPEDAQAFKDQAENSQIGEP